MNEYQETIISMPVISIRIVDAWIIAYIEIA